LSPKRDKVFFVPIRVRSALAEHSFELRSSFRGHWLGGYGRAPKRLLFLAQTVAGLPHIVSIANVLSIVLSPSLLNFRRALVITSDRVTGIS